MWNNDSDSHLVYSRTRFWTSSKYTRYNNRDLPGCFHNTVLYYNYKEKKLVNKSRKFINAVNGVVHLEETRKDDVKKT